MNRTNSGWLLLTMCVVMATPDAAYASGPYWCEISLAQMPPTRTQLHLRTSDAAPASLRDVVVEFDPHLDTSLSRRVLFASNSPELAVSSRPSYISAGSSRYDMSWQRVTGSGGGPEYPVCTRRELGSTDPCAPEWQTRVRISCTAIGSELEHTLATPASTSSVAVEGTALAGRSTIAGLESLLVDAVVAIAQVAVERLRDHVMEQVQQRLSRLLCEGRLHLPRTCGFLRAARLADLGTIATQFGRAVVVDVLELALGDTLNAVLTPRGSSLLLDVAGDLLTPPVDHSRLADEAIEIFTHELADPRARAVMGGAITLANACLAREDCTDTVIRETAQVLFVELAEQASQQLLSQCQANTDCAAAATPAHLARLTTALATTQTVFERPGRVALGAVADACTETNCGAEVELALGFSGVDPAAYNAAVDLARHFVLIRRTWSSSTPRQRAARALETVEALALAILPHIAVDRTTLGTIMDEVREIRSSIQNEDAQGQFEQLLHRHGYTLLVALAERPGDLPRALRGIDIDGFTADAAQCADGLSELTREQRARIGTQCSQLRSLINTIGDTTRLRTIVQLLKFQHNVVPIVRALRDGDLASVLARGVEVIDGALQRRGCGESAGAGLRRRCERRRRAFRGLTGVLTLAVEAVANPTPSDEEREARREAIAETLRHLADMQRDRGERPGHWVASLGAGLGVVGQRVLNGAGQTQFYPSLGVGVAVDFLGARRPVTFHARLTLFDVGGLLRGPLALDQDDANELEVADIFSPRLTLGIGAGRRFPVVFGADVGVVRNTEDGDFGLSLGASLTVWMPVLDLN